MRKIFHTFKTAFQDARKNLFHTLLSVLGIVIGVGALVAILSLIDGMEQYAHDQIAKTTSLESVMISTTTTRSVDNVRVTKEDYAYFDYGHFVQLVNSMEGVKGYMRYQESGFITIDTVDRGVLFTGIVDTQNEQVNLIAGRFISEEDLLTKASHVLISKALAIALDAGKEPAAWINDSITFKDRTYTIIGVADRSSENLELFAPITAIEEEKLRAKPPTVYLIAPSVVEVPNVKQAAEAYVTSAFGEQAGDINIVTNEFRVEQANQGFLVFRLIMGLIVGISVVVGGIGVMNVLLISVTERTAEIGVRKAVGAKRSDIISQFLSESLAISFIGSLMGIVLGVLFTAVAVPIIKHLTKMPFEAAYTLDTLLIITVVSIIVGIVFGTYPAIKASRLDPVEAIRRE